MGLEDMVKQSLLQRQKRRDKRLHEEVIEVGRGRGGKKFKVYREEGYKTFYAKNFVEVFPPNISITPLGSSTFFDDKLGCLKRFLMSHVGQRWDTVFSKLNSVLDTRSLQGLHIVGHIWDFVERNVEMINGKVVCKGHNRTAEWREKFPNKYVYYFYVHPETGILCRWQTPEKQVYPKKARYTKAKEKLKYQLRREQKTDKTPPKVVEKGQNTEGGKKSKALTFYSADYDDDFKKALDDDFFGLYILDYEAVRNQKPKTSEERFRLLFFGYLGSHELHELHELFFYFRRFLNLNNRLLVIDNQRFI